MRRTVTKLRIGVGLLLASIIPSSNVNAEECCTQECIGDSAIVFDGCDSSCGMDCDSACDAGCDSGVGSLLGDCNLSKSLLSGLIKPSDHCFDDFISPMINFVYFEDPRTLTEVRPIFVNHWVPNQIGGGIPAGGSIQLYAAQFRIALTEKLSLIAVKDGFIVDNTDGALDTLLADGWADVTAGLKYNVIRDVARGRIASIGATYEIPIGSTRALQDIGDGEFHFFATGGQRLMGGDAHILSSIGYRLPLDGAVQSSAIHWSNHLDLRLTKTSYVFTEMAWWHWTDDASAGAALGVGGQDLFNLSSNNIAGNDLLTQNVGVKYKPCGNFEAGLAYEYPLTAFKDVIEGRLQTELIFRY
ncbi:MAG: hypothetical protein ACE361_00590 [Aureliella sp.]